MSGVETNNFSRQVQFKTPRMDCPSKVIVREFSMSDTANCKPKTEKTPKSKLIHSKFEATDEIDQPDKAESKKKSFSKFFKLNKKGSKSNKSTDNSQLDNSDDDQKPSNSRRKGSLSNTKRPLSSENSSPDRIQSGDSNKVKINSWNIEDDHSDNKKRPTQDDKTQNKKKGIGRNLKAKSPDTVYDFNDDISVTKKKGQSSAKGSALKSLKFRRNRGTSRNDGESHSSQSDVSTQQQDDDSNDSDHSSPQIVIWNSEHPVQRSKQEKQPRIIDSSDEEDVDETNKNLKKKKSFFAKPNKRKESTEKGTTVTKVTELTPMDNNFDDSDEFTRNTIFPSNPWSVNQYDPDHHSEMIFLLEECEEQSITGKELSTFLADPSLSPTILIIDAREFQHYEETHLLYAQHSSQFENADRQIDLQEIDPEYKMAVLYDSDCLSISIRSSKLSQCYDAFINAGIRTFILQNGFKGILSQYSYLISSKSSPVLPSFFDNEKIGLIHTNTANWHHHVKQFKTKKIVTFSPDLTKGLPSYIDVHNLKPSDLVTKLEKVLLFILHHYKSQSYNTLICYTEEISPAVCILLGYLMCRHHWSINCAYTYASEMRSGMELSKEHFKLLQKLESKCYGKIVSKTLSAKKSASKISRLLSGGSDGKRSATKSAESRSSDDTQTRQERRNQRRQRREDDKTEKEIEEQSKKIARRKNRESRLHGKKGNSDDDSS